MSSAFGRQKEEVGRDVERLGAALPELRRRLLGTRGHGAHVGWRVAGLAGQPRFRAALVGQDAPDFRARCQHSFNLRPSVCRTNTNLPYKSVRLQATC